MAGVVTSAILRMARFRGGVAEIAGDEGDFSLVPYATLIVRDFKKIETRRYPAPRRILGERIAIASTKIF